jgi:hypothetical protein
MQQTKLKSCPIYMRWILIILLLIIFGGCRRQQHCENATVYKSQLCGISWEVEYEGKRYPVQNLPDNLKIDKNRIFIESYHFYNDPRLCACCGYSYLVIDNASDDAICL